VKQHDLTKPQGVRGRNSDNDLCKETLGWAPEVTLEEGLRSTYSWIEAQLEAAGRLPMKVN
jgi:nucleoside-diphosphate-sugar epimerase